MKIQLLKYKGIGILTLLFIQLLTLAMFSENRKSAVIIKDLKFVAKISMVDSLAFNTNIIGNQVEQMRNLQTRFKDTIENVSIHEIEDWYKYRIDSNYFAIAIIDSSLNSLVLEVHTNAGTLYYGETWYNQYVWILYKWFKLKHVNTGVS